MERRRWFGYVILIVTGCTFDPAAPTSMPGDAETRDAGSMLSDALLDASQVDTGPVDVGLQDAGPVDVGMVDAGAPECGNGILEGNERCDDNNLTDGDGCRQNCTIELGFRCDTAVQPTQCVPYPRITVDDVTIEEGRPAFFRVNLSTIVAFDVQFDWQTMDGTAIASDDYENVLQDTFTVPAGIETVELEVATVRDIDDEDDETFSVQLSNPVDAIIDDATGMATIADVLPLVDDDLVVRYFLSEAAEGSFTGEILDAAPTPFHLMPVNEANGPLFTEAPTGRGVRWDQAGGPGRIERVMSGSKVFNRMNGVQRVTFEVVVEFQNIVGATPLIYLGEADGSEAYALLIRNDEVILVRDGRLDIVWSIELQDTGRRVLTIVYDTPQSSVTDRIDFYVDGEKSTNSNRGPVQDERFDLESDNVLIIGNRPGSDRSIEGVISYVALYDVPLSQEDVSRNARWLLIGDDPL